MGNAGWCGLPVLLHTETADNSKMKRKRIDLKSLCDRVGKRPISIESKVQSTSPSIQLQAQNGVTPNTHSKNPGSATAAAASACGWRYGVRPTWLEARKVFVRMLSGGGGGVDVPVNTSDPSRRLSYRKASALEHELDHSGVRVTPDVAERALERLDNTGMLAYRFFEWARRQKHCGCAHTVRSYHTVVASLAKIRQYQLMWDIVAVMRRDGVVNVETFGIIMRKWQRGNGD